MDIPLRNATYIDPSGIDLIFTPEDFYAYILARIKIAKRILISSLYFGDSYKEKTIVRVSLIIE